MMTIQRQLERAVADAQAGYACMQTLSIVRRVALMECIADAIEALGDDLIATAQRETALSGARLTGEKAGTVDQWRLYGRAVASGIYADARIDRGDGRTKTDIRKCTQGIGPVVVFGASNFPFAFSTAGGDTVSAIAAGCSVIVKAHSSHRETSRMMAEAVQSGLQKYGAPASIFGCVSAPAAEVGLLITHPAVKAIGFTGFYAGGRAIFDLANQRPEPIPVFALPEYLSARAEALAKQYVASLTLGVGQFCTNPGVVVGIRGEGWERFKRGVRAELSGRSGRKDAERTYPERLRKRRGTMGCLGTGPSGSGKWRLRPRPGIRHHGHPFHLRGPDAAKRFLRPLIYQNWPDSLLPEELKDGNPLKIPLMEK